MHFAHILTDCFWVLSIVLDFTLAVAMVGRNLARKYPFFLAYIGADGCLSTVLFVLDKLPGVSGQLWWRFYVPGLAIVALLQFCVIYMVFGAIFKTRVLSDRFGVAAFRWSFLAFFLMGLGLASLTETHEKYYVFMVLHLLQQTASLVQIGLLVCLFAISAFLKLPWRNFAFGIALGIGIVAAVDLSAAVIKTHFGLAGNQWINLATLGTYVLCVLVWMFYLWLPERVQSAAPKLPEHDLEVWNEELQRLASR
jgi:hypothetical protein